MRGRIICDLFAFQFNNKRSKKNVEKHSEIFLKIRTPERLQLGNKYYTSIFTSEVRILLRFKRYKKFSLFIS